MWKKIVSKKLSATRRIRSRVLGCRLRFILTDLNKAVSTSGTRGGGDVRAVNTDQVSNYVEPYFFFLCQCDGPTRLILGIELSCFLWRS